VKDVINKLADIITTNRMLFGFVVEDHPVYVQFSWPYSRLKTQTNTVTLYHFWSIPYSVCNGEHYLQTLQRECDWGSTGGGWCYRCKCFSRKLKSQNFTYVVIYLSSRHRIWSPSFLHFYNDLIPTTNTMYRSDWTIRACCRTWTVQWYSPGDGASVQPT